MDVLFNTLTSKIFAGTTVLLTLSLVAVMFFDNREIAHRDKLISERDDAIVALRLENATLKTNQSSLEGSVALCSSSVAVTAAKAEQAASAGTAALEQARKNATRIAATVDQINAMPATSCANAEAILRAGARP